MPITFEVGQKERVEKLFSEMKPPVKVEINMTLLNDLFTKAGVSIQGLVATAEEFSVTSIETRGTAIEMGTQAKTISNMIEKKRKEIKRPYLDFSQTLDGLVKPLRDNLALIENGLKRKIKVHVDAENKRKAEQERKRLEVEAALNPAVEPPKVPEPGTHRSKPVIESKISTGSGSASVKKEWKHKLTDLSKVPQKFLMLNEDAVKTAIELGVREIPGIDIYEDSKIQLTVSRGGL